MNGQNPDTESESTDASLPARLEALHPMSYGWALNCCGFQAPEAEDVLQSVYQKILAGRAHYDGRSAFKTWLFAVIRTTAAEERRRRFLRLLRLDGYAREHRDDYQPAERGRGLEESERLLALQQALAQLPRRQREILHLVFYQDLTIEEAARAMGVGLGSARTHYERAKHRLGVSLKSAEHYRET